MDREFTEAWRNDGATETLWYNPSNQIVVLAPHGGDIEFGTDDAAARIHKGLRANGLDPVTWMFHGFGENAYDRYHLSSNEIEADSFSRLSEISGTGFRYAVSVHMHNEDYVAVGGLVDDEIRLDVAEALRQRLPSSKSVVTDLGQMKYSGTQKGNVVNWITEDGVSGLQLELTPVTAYRFRKRVARSVVDVYSKLLQS